MTENNQQSGIPRELSIDDICLMEDDNKVRYVYLLNMDVNVEIERERHLYRFVDDDFHYEYVCRCDSWATGNPY
ncbi:MAG: hypothetical protein KAS04_04905 [Candidatus Aenigmarchaeota archaeon]|nr:hypothetical protein [Candidatus Aenigmarchaeota archaeon]